MHIKGGKPFDPQLVTSVHREVSGTEGGAMLALSPARSCVWSLLFTHNQVRCEHCYCSCAPYPRKAILTWIPPDMLARVFPDLALRAFSTLLQPPNDSIHCNMHSPMLIPFPCQVSSVLLSLLRLCTFLRKCPPVLTGITEILPLHRQYDTSD